VNRLFGATEAVVKTRTLQADNPNQGIVRRNRGQHLQRIL
jgi:hypothetical protein